MYETLHTRACLVGKQAKTHRIQLRTIVLSLDIVQVTKPNCNNCKLGEFRGPIDGTILNAV